MDNHRLRCIYKLQDMNPHDIKALLGKKGVKQTQLAAALKVSQQMVSAVILSTSNSRRVQLAIARATGLPASDLWPESEKSGRRKQKKNKPVSRRHTTRKKRKDPP